MIETPPIQQAAQAAKSTIHTLKFKYCKNTYFTQLHSCPDKHQARRRSPG